MPPVKKKKPKKKKGEPKQSLSPQDLALEDCATIAMIADDIEVYINEEIKDESFKAYLLGRLEALQSNIDFLGHALAQPEEAQKEMEEGEGPHSVSDVFEEMINRISNIELGLVTVGIGTFCEDCGKYAPPVERVEDEHEPVCFIPPTKEEKPN